MKKLTLILLLSYAFAVVLSYGCAALKAQDSIPEYSNAENIDNSIPDSVLKDAVYTEREQAKKQHVLDMCFYTVLFTCAGLVIIYLSKKLHDGERGN